MTEIDTSGLVDLAARRKAKTTPVKEHRGIDFAALRVGTYLAADPSLSLGLVMMEVAPGCNVSVHMAEKFTVPPVAGLKGWEDVLHRVDILQARLTIFVRSWITRTDWGTVCTVHEAPPMGHGKILNPEISLITGYAFRQATASLPLLGMVRRQDHYRFICGNPNASKPVCHAKLKTYFDQIKGSELVTNEATRDALQVALYAAAREV